VKTDLQEPTFQLDESFLCSLVAIHSSLYKIRGTFMNEFLSIDWQLIYSQVIERRTEESPLRAHSQTPTPTPTEFVVEWAGLYYEDI